MFTIHKRAEEKPQSSDAQGCLELDIQCLTPQCTPHINLCTKIRAEINCSIRDLTHKTIQQTMFLTLNMRLVLR